MIMKYDLKIDLFMPEPHYVKFLFFTVQIFEFLTFDKSLAIHLLNVCSECIYITWITQISFWVILTEAF